MKSMTPSTSGQIGKLEEIYGEGLKRAQLPKDAVQAVITDGQAAPAMIKELVEVTCKYVEANSNMIVRRVKVDRKLAPQQILDVASRRQFTDKAVVAGMPSGSGEEVDVYFFHLGRSVSEAELEEEYKLRGLTPDPYAQCCINTDEPEFADKHPNGCHWQDADGKWCFLTFRQWNDDRRVHVYRSASDWHGDWWFAGVRK